MSLEAPEIFADLSKNLVDAATLRFLADLARECGVEALRDAMLAGAEINVTERRAVLHTALRAPPGSAPFGDEVHAVLAAMLDFAESVRARAREEPAGAAGTRLRHVVNIGIGGSDLGPQMAVRALAGFAAPELEFHFVANVDGADLASVLARVAPAQTLFVVASKTFTTQETMANAETAKAWFVANGGTRIEQHFVAATSNVEAAARFGITTTFGFWDWVGGRYSLWSAIGLPIAIAIGAERFRELLAGARAMDEHFAQAPIERNLPMLLGLIDVWYRNFHGFTSRCIAPYAQALQRLPAFLQQLEMESNGKRVDRTGAPLPFATSPVVWGEPGTNAQHAYFQMLHQGSDVVPVEFILLRRSSAVEGGAAPGDIERQHRMLLANGLAQGQALMQGRAGASEPHRDFPGNRPSTTLLLERLTPRSLGALLALYEHRVFTSGAVWGIDSFDQWGVELGKAVSHGVLARLQSAEQGQTPSGSQRDDALDPSTAGLLRRLRGETS
jgi:glucose-6-phosphate isomerase